MSDLLKTYRLDQLPLDVQAGYGPGDAPFFTSYDTRQDEIVVYFRDERGVRLPLLYNKWIYGGGAGQKKWYISGGTYCRKR